MNVKFVSKYLGYLMGSLASQSERFNLPVIKGFFPHKFCQKENFNYLGPVPDAKFFLGFGELTPLPEVFEFLEERLADGRPWSFNEELIKYCKKGYVHV